MKDTVSIEHVADAKSSSLTAPEKATGTNDDNVAVEAHIRHKFDRRILPLGTLIYLFAQIDRSNMSNAVVLGMNDEIGLRGNQFNISLTLFFVTYILFEIPANMACHRLGPRVWLSVITFAFGLITLCTAFIKNYAGLVVCRLLLGVCESGVQPGIVYAYSQFYRRHEMASRLGLKAVGASIAGAFGGLLGSGLSSIPPHGMLTSWRWIFLVEGAFTVLLAGFVFNFMPRDVQNSKFLTDDEREIAYRRIADENMSTDDERMGLETFKKALWNINTQMVAVALIMSLLSLTSLSLFMPTLLKTSMGYSATHAQLLSVPPYVAASIFCILGSFLADRLHSRGYILLAFTPITITGFIILATVKSSSVRYFALFLATTGAFTCSPILLAWVSGNAAGPAVRAVVTGYAVGIANLGSIIATWTYLPAQAPYYTAGHWMNFGAACILFGVVGCNMVYLLGENRLRAAGKRDYRVAGASQAEVERLRLGHLHPEFRYTP